MQTERLVVMANQIGDFYQSLPDEAQAKHDIAEHLMKFWAKSMRDQLVADINSEQCKALHSIVKSAVMDHIVVNA